MDKCNRPTIVPCFATDSVGVGATAAFRTNRPLGRLARLAALVLAAFPVMAAATEVAFHYSSESPVDLLRGFEAIVVEPEHGHDPRSHGSRNGEQSALFAHVLIGEIASANVDQFKLSDDMFLSQETAWETRIVNQAHPDWPEQFAKNVIEPLWAKGFRGFFLDSMDVYQSVTSDTVDVQAQHDGLVRTIEQLHRRFPGIKLLAHRGFEVMPRIASKLQAIVAQSLFSGWDSDTNQYVEVSSADRQRLLAKFKQARELGLATVSVDYADPADRDKTRELARQIKQLGVTPYVTDQALKSVGIGNIEVIPRRILLIHNSTPPNATEQESTASLMATMPLQYLGFRVDLLDLHRYELPAGPIGDRYAGVVGLFEKDEPKLAEPLSDFLSRAKAEKVPIAFLNSFGLSPNGSFVRQLGIRPVSPAMRAPVTISDMASPEVGEEILPRPNARALAVRAPKDAKPWLTVSGAAGNQADGIAITSWGGYALRPYTYVSVGKNGVHRWVVNPIRFFERALLRDRVRPQPDVTTENGRRLLLIHIDGDGFASRAEIPGLPWAAKVMHEDFIARYEVPHTVSVIEGETGPKGLYPQFSAQLEGIAKDIFKLDHVEIASHSYSHPFFWYSVVDAAARGESSSHAEKLQHLPIEGYNFDLTRDIVGSADYINSRLAPPGKKTKVFLWTGDCVPPPAALREAYGAGLLNMNAGDTMMTNKNPSLTSVAPMSIRKDGWLQVFAPNQNENVYTNDWTGPFYGFDRVIETFKLTNSPRRLKPINIYYHTYSASKSAAIAALHRVYRYALSQPTNPVYGSEYIQKVHDFESMAIAREISVQPGREVWRIAGDGNLRTLRVPNDFAKRVNWRESTGLAGRKHGVDGTYLHLSAQRARLVLEPMAAEPAIHVRAANGRINDFERTDEGIQFHFSSHVDGRLTLVHEPECEVFADATKLKELAPSREAEVPGTLNVHDYRLRKRNAIDQALVTVRC